MKRKNRWMISAALAGVVFACSVSTGFAQQPKEEKEEVENARTEGKPSWIKMMSDPKVNYFKAVKAYETWEKEQKKEQKDIGEQRAAYEEEYGEYRREQKQFEYWRNTMFPFVQEDGSILSEKKRNKILRKIKH